MTSTIPLDASQRAVAFAPVETRQYITAAAGQGKTEVVLSRIQFLVEEEGLNPAEDVLVLSFSRAAVEAVRKRSDAFDLEAVTIRTFDSFAATVILEQSSDPEADSRGSFNQRIRRATEWLRNEGLPDSLYSLRHLFIDEAQDLVGDRAELVKALLEACPEDMGFTVLGDPLQGVYDFQLEASSSKMTASDFAEFLTTKAALHRRLEGHYRTKSDRTRELIDIGDRIRALPLLDQVTAKKPNMWLDNFRREGGVSDSVLDEWASLEPDPDTTAILCFDNYDVLLVSELLREQRIVHKVRRRAEDMSVAPWVYNVFRDMDPVPYSRQEVERRITEADVADTEERWLELKTAEGDRRTYDSLDVGLLGRRLRAQSVPLNLTVDDSCPVIVSTIHRAKGLEFDTVLYVEPSNTYHLDRDLCGLLKQKYVALSRAREEIYSVRPPAKPGFGRKDGRTDRWLQCGYKGPKRIKPWRIEFKNDDVDLVVPYGGSAGACIEVQEALSSTDIYSQDVVGHRLEFDFEETPRYELRTSDGKPIARTGRDFSDHLEWIFGWKGYDFKWPARIEGLHVSSIECATGSPEITQEAGLGRSGMWLVPRLAGLARPKWEEETA